MSDRRRRQDGSELERWGKGAPSSRPRSRFLIIHNVVAGMRRRWLLRQACRALEAAGAELTIVSADSLEADRALAESAIASGAYDAVVAAGGDSTVRGVASGLCGSSLPLGIIAVGTGNVLAEEIRFRSGPRRIAHNLIHGSTVSIHPGRANEENFFAMAGAGFDARVLTRLDTAWKRRLGKLAYLWPVTIELVRKPQIFEAIVDGHTHRCSWLIITKASRYGGPFQLTRHRDFHGEGFHAVIVSTRNRASLVGVLLAIAAGRVEWHPAVKVLPCSTVLIPHQPSVLVQLDGEVIGGTPIKIGPAKTALQIIVPA